MIAVQAAIHPWHDFFIAAATAAATLLGLLSVAVTLNSDIILLGTRPHLKRIAEQAFQNYLVVVLAALLLLVPDQDWRSIALEMLLAGAIMAAYATFRTVSAWRVSDDDFTRTRTWKRLVPSLLGNLMLVYSGWKYRSAYDEQAMVLFGLSAIVLIVTATATSWDLLLRVAEIRHRSPRPE